MYISVMIPKNMVMIFWLLVSAEYCLHKGDAVTVGENWFCISDEEE